MTNEDLLTVRALLQEKVSDESVKFQGVNTRQRSAEAVAVVQKQQQQQHCRVTEHVHDTTKRFTAQNAVTPFDAILPSPSLMSTEVLGKRTPDELHL